MPTLFLSPSTQEFNPFIDGGNEEYYMNLIADAMEPYLYASGINFVRNNPTDNVRQVIAQSNSGNYDLHLAIHSNASPENVKGQNTGADIYYYPTSPKYIGAFFLDIELPCPIQSKPATVIFFDVKNSANFSYLPICSPIPWAIITVAIVSPSGL